MSLPKLFCKDVKYLHSLIFSCLKLFGLKHEGFEAGQRIGLLLTIIGHVQDGNVAVLLTVPLEQSADDCAGHARKRHNVHDSAGATLCEIDAFSYGKDGFPFEGRIEIGLSLSENRGRLWLTVMSEGPLKKPFQMVLVFLLVIICEQHPQQSGQRSLSQAPSFRDGVDVEDPFA